MKPVALSGAALILGASILVLSACQKEGPMERAGKDLDNAVQSVGQQIEKAGDNIENAAGGDKK